MPPLTLAPVRARFSRVQTRLLAASACCAFLALFGTEAAHAQEGLQPGEGYLTRFSGTATVNGKTVIDTAGTVGSIVDLRNPAQPPRGQHWINEPQRNPVTAAEVGQVVRHRAR